MNRNKSSPESFIHSVRATKLVLAATCGLLIAGAIAAAPTTQPLEPGVLPPMTHSPAVSPASVVVIPYRPYLDKVQVTPAPLMLKSDGLHPIHARKAVDVPLLVQAGADLPAATVLPAGLGLQISIPTSATIPIATLAASADTSRPTLSTDPTLDLAPAAALTTEPPPRSSSPAPLGLTIPDPSRQPGALPSPQSTSEDPPVTSLDRPGVPPLASRK